MSVRDVLVRRASTTSSASASSTTSCVPLRGLENCAKPSSNNTLPIALGVAIPLAIALVVLFFLHRRHVRRLKREDALQASIDINQDDFDMSPLRPARNGSRKAEKPYSLFSQTDYLVPMSDRYQNAGGRLLDGPYNVVPREVSRLAVHANGSYPALPRQPPTAQRKLHQPDSHYSKYDNNTYTPSRVSTLTSASVEEAVNRMHPVLPLGRPAESYEMSNIAKPELALRSDSSDPIVDAVYHGFQQVSLHDPESDLSSSPPGKSMSFPSSNYESASSSRTPSPALPVRTISLTKLSRPLSTAPQIPRHTTPQYDSSDEEVIDMDVPVTDRLVTPEPDSLIPPSNDLSREKSLSSQADAEARAIKIRSFYNEYFDKNNRLVRQKSTVAHDDSAITYDSTGRVRPPRPLPSPDKTQVVAPALKPLKRFQPGPVYVGMPRSQSSMSGRPLEDTQLYRQTERATIVRPLRIDTRGQQPASGTTPIKLPPLEPLSPLPVPHQIGQDEFLSSPTSFAPPRRHNGFTIGSSGNSPTVSQQHFSSPMRDLPTPYQLRNSASYTTLDFLPSKKYSPGPGLSNDVDENDKRASHLPQALVPVGKDGLQSNLRPQWGMRDV
ncbi:hypothetical protein V1512DRAFT_260294 [Lipomyces arxii]|uniref:uncharacterized protein n=1 Tax=Lipomyces arxii TaxID=56418 RepID=UPI0034CF0D86